jgi:hypothetical protein
MNIGKPARQLIILLLLSIISAVSCQQPTLPNENVTENISLESVVDIPQGTKIKREMTYDDISSSGPGLSNYRVNCRNRYSIKEAEITFSGCEFAPRVRYRDNIETKAGQVRYNIFWVDLLDKSVVESLYRQYEVTGTKPLHYSIKLAGTVPDGIQAINVFPSFSVGLGPHIADAQFLIMIEISPQVKPGDYTLYFIVDANGQNCPGKLPCVIHVIE